MRTSCINKEEASHESLCPTTVCAFTWSACVSTVSIVRCEAAEVRYRGAPAELTINEISERTLQIVLAPIG